MECCFLAGIFWDHLMMIHGMGRGSSPERWKQVTPISTTCNAAWFVSEHIKFHCLERFCSDQLFIQLSGQTRLSVGGNYLQFTFKGPSRQRTNSNKVKVCKTKGLIKIGAFSPRLDVAENDPQITFIQVEVVLTFDTWRKPNWMISMYKIYNQFK